MTQKDILKKFETLPPDAQKQVLDFISFLETHYSLKRKKTTNNRLSEEKFIGIWRDRKDLRNSSSWVRNLRKVEWEKVE